MVAAEITEASLKNFRKKFLTNASECGKLKKLLLLRAASDVKKTLKKVLDKLKVLWYSK